MAFDWKAFSENLRERSLAGMGQLPQYRAAQAQQQQAEALRDEQRRKQLLTLNRTALVDLASGRRGQAEATIQQALDLVPESNRQQVLGVLQRIQQGDQQGALEELKYLDDRAVQVGMMEPIGGSPDLQVGTKQTLVKDPEGNLFYATQVADKTTGRTRTSYAPLSPDGPERPTGRLTLVDELGLSAAESAQRQTQQAAEQASAVATATAQAELKTMPELRAAVKAAEQGAMAAAKANEKDRSGQGAYRVWETGMSSLAEAFDKTLTGPVVGWLPAMTSNQQMAVGATAAIAPILKQLFRASGEGVFTDRDQQLLLDMAPTRRDTPEAAAWKIQNIDNIVKAKLGIEDGGQTPQPSQAGSIDDLVGKYLNGGGM